MALRSHLKSRSSKRYGTFNIHRIPHLSIHTRSKHSEYIVYVSIHRKQVWRLVSDPLHTSSFSHSECTDTQRTFRCFRTIGAHKPIGMILAYIDISVVLEHTDPPLHSEVWNTYIIKSTQMRRFFEQLKQMLWMASSSVLATSQRHGTYRSSVSIECIDRNESFEQSRTEDRVLTTLECRILEP